MQDEEKKTFLRIETKDKKWVKHVRRILTAVLFIAVLYFFLGGQFGLVNYFRFQQLKKTYREELEYEIRRGDSLRAEIERLKSDTLYIESLARKHLGMIKPGEEIVIFKEKKKEDSGK